MHLSHKYLLINISYQRYEIYSFKSFTLCHAKLIRNFAIYNEHATNTQLILIILQVSKENVRNDQKKIYTRSKYFQESYCR